jgi:diadenosine tetraphosphate (Ap4A) HIT family hydrolase
MRQIYRGQFINLLVVSSIGRGSYINPENISGIMARRCLGCALINREKKTLGGVLFSGRHFEVRQDYEVPIPGFLVIASKRHIVGFADFDEAEKKEFINLLCRIRTALKQALGIKYISILHREELFESKTCPSHFHLALLPKYPWMKRFNNTDAILDYARKSMNTPQNIKRVLSVIERLKRTL